MLIPSPRHTDADVRAWAKLAAVDAMRWRRDERRLRRALERAARDAREFADAGPCYAGLSAGKDSVLLCHVLHAHDVRVPIVYVEVMPHGSPEAPAVIEAVQSWGVAVDRIRVDCERDPSTGGWLGTGRLSEGFARAAEKYGDRYISGVRRDESHAREMRFRNLGVSSDRTCAPLSSLSTDDVFACAHGLGLPLHPAYAMTGGGLFDRAHLRVSTLGGSRGTAMGRREWEMRYYADELRALGLSSRFVSP